MTTLDTAVIVIDSGFSLASIRSARQVIGVFDCRTGNRAVGVEVGNNLHRFAGDPMLHGSIVLDRLTHLVPDAPVILVRAFDDYGRCVRTSWRHDQIAAVGWTEGYRWAVDLARRQRLKSVANCSFGGSTHAVDGTGWESFQLGQETGSGKPGHLVVAAAGPGDGRAKHASWTQTSDSAQTLLAKQSDTTTYNLWGPPDVGSADWHLVVTHDGLICEEISGRKVPPNIWNQGQQHSFSVHGAGNVHITLHRYGVGTAAASAQTLRFECWVTSGSAVFLNNVDLAAVMEPAVFPHVLAVGLRGKEYAQRQDLPGVKPDVLLPGDGELSFRVPEVTAAVARLLGRTEAPLDIDAVRVLLGKYPDVRSLSGLV